MFINVMTVRIKLNFRLKRILLVLCISYDSTSVCSYDRVWRPIFRCIRIPVHHLTDCHYRHPAAIATAITNTRSRQPILGIIKQSPAQLVE